MNVMRQITYEITDYGPDSPSSLALRYFLETSHYPFTSVGVGETHKDALEDAVNQIVESSQDATACEHVDCTFAPLFKELKCVPQTVWSIHDDCYETWCDLRNEGLGASFEEWHDDCERAYYVIVRYSIKDCQCLESEG